MNENQPNIRLTNYIRDKALSELINNRFDKESKLLDKDYANFALEVYDEAFDKNTRAKMSRLPKGWLMELGFIEAFCGGESHYLRFPEKVEKRFPYSFTRNADVRQRHQMGEATRSKFNELNARKEKLRIMKSEARSQAKVILYSHSTVGSLLKVWPEVKKFLPREEAVTVALALPIKKLNEMLGLQV